MELSSSVVTLLVRLVNTFSSNRIGIGGIGIAIFYNQHQQSYWAQEKHAGITMIRPSQGPLHQPQSLLRKLLRRTINDDED